MNTQRIITASVGLAIAAASAAAVTTEGFETTDPDWSFGEVGSDPNTVASISTAQAFDGTRSLSLSVGANNEYARFQGLLDQPIKLRDISATWHSYVEGGGANNLRPYVMYAVDVNSDGIVDFADDSLVIQFVPGSNTFTTDAWFPDDSSGTYHVSSNRAGIPAGAFLPNGSSADTLDNLYDIVNTDAGVAWGDLDVIGYRFGAGFWPNSGQWQGYVDGVSIVPAPGAAGLLAAAGIAATRRRR